MSVFELGIVVVVVVVIVVVIVSVVLVVGVGLLVCMRVCMLVCVLVYVLVLVGLYSFVCFCLCVCVGVCAFVTYCHVMSSHGCDAAHSRATFEVAQCHPFSFACCKLILTNMWRPNSVTVLHVLL